MENASKALIIAGAVLIAVMLISIFMYVFNAITKFNSDTQAQLYSNEVISANRFFVESAYDLDYSTFGIQIKGYDVYNLICKADDINNNADSPNSITINFLKLGTFRAIDIKNLTEPQKNLLNMTYTYSYSTNSEGYVSNISFN